MNKRKQGTGSIDACGYHIIRNKRKGGHPLALADGRVYVHRMVLFDSIGYGPHRCHWCEAHVNWNAPRPARLVVDHLDSNRLNNHISNLVPSCDPCNMKRGKIRQRQLKMMQMMNDLPLAS